MNLWFKLHSSLIIDIGLVLSFLIERSKNINFKNLGDAEVLSKDELIKIAGGTGSGSGGDGFVKYTCNTISAGSYECYQNENSPLACVDQCVNIYGDDCFGCYTVIN